MKRNGFTLVELLAAVVILGIVSGVAVPSVINVMNKNRLKTYKTDASRIVHSIKSKYEKDTTIEEPDEHNCILFTIDDLESSSLSGPNGGKYQNAYSYATINKDSSGNFIYGVQMLEDYKSGGKELRKGIRYTARIDLSTFNFDSLKVIDDPRKFISVDDLKSSSEFSNCRTIINNRSASSEASDKKKNTVTYDYTTNGGTNADKKEELVEYNDPVNLSYKATKPGYTFVGWGLNKSDTDPLTTYFMSDDDITLYAIFKKTASSNFYYYNNGNVAVTTKTCEIYNKKDNCTFDLPQEVNSSRGPNDTGYKGVSSKENSLESVMEFTSDNKNYYAYYDGTYNIKYEGDEHSKNLSTRQDSCYVTSYMKNNKYIEPTCTKRLPSYNVDSGYSKYGFIDSSDNKFIGKEGASFEINRRETTLIATSSDSMMPNDIQLSKEGDSNAQKEHQVVLTFRDNESGLADRISYKWGLSKSKNAAPSTYYEDEFSTNNANEIERVITLGSLTGNYYLWIVPTSYSDSTGNKNTKTVISSGTYNLVNNGSVTLKTEPQNLDYDDNTESYSFNLVLTVNGLGDNPNINSSMLNNIKMKSRSKDGNGDTKDINGVKTTFINQNKNNITLKFTFVKSNSHTGLATIILPEGLFYDNLGNKILSSSINTSVELIEDEFALVFEEVYNAKEINDFKKTYSPKDDDFTLPQPTREGYTFKGWTSDEISEPQKVVTIKKGSTGDKIFTAHWEEIIYPISYDLSGGQLEAGVANITEYTITSNAFVVYNPMKEYYNFTGWTGTGLDKLTPVLVIQNGWTGKRDYKANFKPIEYKVNFDLNGGKLYDASGNQLDESKITYNYETGYTLPYPKKIIDNVNADFNGWTGTNLDVLTKDVSWGEGNHDDRIYKAHYRQAQIKVKKKAITNKNNKITIDLVLDTTKEYDKPYKINDNIYNLEVYIGNEKKDDVKITYDKINNSVELIVNNPNDAKGDITVNIKDDAMDDGDYNTTFKSNLSVGNTEDLNIISDTDKVSVGSAITLNASQSDVTWTSSNPDFATIDASGTVTGIKKGTTTITLSKGDKKDTMLIMVE